ARPVDLPECLLRDQVERGPAGSWHPSPGGSPSANGPVPLAFPASGSATPPPCPNWCVRVVSEVGLAGRSLEFRCSLRLPLNRNVAFGRSPRHSYRTHFVVRRLVD